MLPDLRIDSDYDFIRATAKYWLYFLRGYPTRANPVQLPRTIEKYVLFLPDPR